MANSKVTALGGVTTAADTDLVYVVSDAAGTPVSKKMTIANLKKEMFGEGGDITGNLNVSGNVGIGTTAPDHKLQVVGNIGLSGHVVGTDGTSNPTNLIYNGDFESWSAGASAAPDGWVAQGTGVSVSASVQKKIGSYSVKLTRGGTNCNLAYAGGAHAEKGIEYWKGRTVTLSVWVKTSISNSVSVAIVDGVSSSSAIHTGDDTWQLLTVTRTISASANQVGAYFYISTTDGSAYFDGAMLVEGSSAFAFSPKPINEGINTSTVPLSIAGKVGIGTTAPNALLEVSSNTGLGEGTGTPTTIRITDVDTGAAWATDTTWGNLDFYNNDTTGGGPAIRARVGVGNGAAGGGTSYVSIGVHNNTALTEVLRLTHNGDIYTNAWADYSATSTIVGWASFTNKSIFTKKIGKTVFVNFYIDGTSNSTGTTFTLPYTSVNSATLRFGGAMYVGTDNGTELTVATKCRLPNNSATVSCYTDMSTGTWTASGIKIIAGSFFYESA